MKTSIAEIINGLDLTAEERTQVQTILASEKVRGAIDGELKNVQSEFSRTLDESRTAVAQAKADKDAYYGQMNTWKARQEDTLKNVQEQARKDRETSARLQAGVASLQAAGILDEDDIKGLLAGAPPATPPPGTPPASTPPEPPKEGKYVTQEEGLQYVQLPAFLLDLSNEHQRITGKPLENAVELIKKSTSESKPLRQVWEEQYNIPKLREEQATRAQQEHDEKVRREERTKVLSEMQNPTSRPATGAYQSPVLVAAQKAQQNSVPHAGSRRGVELAMAAHTAGKYEGGVVHNP